jgi:predicted dehydrogenase
MAKKTQKASKQTFKPIRMGIIGIGRAGWGMHTKELAGREDKFQIVAACDIDASRTAKMVERYGCAAYADAKQMIADPDVELVDIASRSRDHVAHAKLALKAGKHVFLEKPISLTYAQAKQLQAAAEKAEGNLFFRHNRRFEPAFQHIRKIMDDGLLGSVYEIKLRRHGFGRRDDWQTVIAHGGGQLLNWGPHIIDHGLRLLDSPCVELWSDLKRVAAVGDAEDHLKIIMKGRNGRVVDLEISGGAAIKEPEYIIFGDRGALTCDGREIHLRCLDPKKKLKPRKAKLESPPLEGGFGSADALSWIEKTIPVASPTGEDTASIWDHLFASIRRRRKFPITTEEAVEVMKVVSQVKKGTPFA